MDGQCPTDCVAGPSPVRVVVPPPRQTTDPDNLRDRVARGVNAAATPVLRAADLVAPWHTAHAPAVVLHHVTRMRTAGFDTPQISAVLTDHLEALDYTLTRSTSSHSEGVRSRVSEAVNTADVTAWRTQHNLPPCRVPSPIEWEAERTLPDRVTGALRGWEQEMRFAAGWYDCDPHTVRDILTRLRDDLTRTHPSDREAVAARRLYYRLYLGSDRVTRPPLDDATAVALHRLHTHPSVMTGIPRRRRDVVVFDTETNGFGVDADILTMAVQRYTCDGRLLAANSFMFCPTQQRDGQPWTGNDDAVRTHGLTSADVAGQPPFAHDADRIRALFDDATIAGHNVEFDLSKLNRHLGDAGLDSVGDGALLDTLRLGRTLEPDSRRHSLTVLADRHGLNTNPDAAHTATYDTQLCADLLWTYKRESAATA